VSDGPIPDDEVLYRRIPPGETWLQPPDQISSYNFKLRGGETGLSAYRARIVDAAGVLAKAGAIAGSKIAAATVGQIRAAKNAKGEPLNLDVVAVNDEDDLGHSEIRCREPTTGLIVPGKISNSAAKALRDLFKLV
jgi:hypothetical protein